MHLMLCLQLWIKQFSRSSESFQLYWILASTSIALLRCRFTSNCSGICTQLEKSVFQLSLWRTRRETYKWPQHLQAHTLPRQDACDWRESASATRVKDTSSQMFFGCALPCMEYVRFQKRRMLHVMWCCLPKTPKKVKRHWLKQAAHSDEPLLIWRVTDSSEHYLGSQAFLLGDVASCRWKSCTAAYIIHTFTMSLYRGAPNTQDTRGKFIGQRKVF